MTFTKALQSLDILFNAAETVRDELLTDPRGADGMAKKLKNDNLWKEPDFPRSLAKKLLKIREALGAEQLETLIELGDYVADPATRSEDFGNMLRLYYEERPQKGFPVSPKGRIERMDVLAKTWLVLYFAGLRFERFIESIMRQHERSRALPCGVCTTMFFGVMLERSRYLRSVLNFEGSVYVYTESPTLSGKSRILPTDHPDSSLAHLVGYFYLLQFRLLSEAWGSSGEGRPYYLMPRASSTYHGVSDEIPKDGAFKKDANSMLKHICPHADAWVCEEIDTLSPSVTPSFRRWEPCVLGIGSGSAYTRDAETDWKNAPVEGLRYSSRILSRDDLVIRQRYYQQQLKLIPGTDRTKRKKKAHFEAGGE